MFKTRQMILMTMVFIMFMPVFLSEPSVQAGAFDLPVDLPRTGQTTCYDTNGAMVNCIGTGQDGDIQSGVAWPNPRFTDNNDGTVTDNLTSLRWTKDGNVPGPDVCLPAIKKEWQDALNYVNCLNTNNYLGYTDWRLPNVIELESLVNAEQPDIAPWLNTQGFNNVQSDTYWSSTTYTHHPVYAWWVNMWRGVVNSLDKSYSYRRYVWPVRSGLYDAAQLWQTGQTTCYDSSGVVITCSGTGQDGDIKAGVTWPFPRFTDNGNGTVTDELTSLVWTLDANAPGPSACYPGTSNKKWQEALDYAACLNTNSYLGYTDWRLPNIKELHSLTDYSMWSPALPSVHPFLNVQLGYYWSSTSYAGNPFSAWVAFMPDGTLSSFNKPDGYAVWPVRSGQVGPLVHSIIGTVTENSIGLGGVTITLSGAASATTTTAADGTYSFPDLPDGDYTVTPSLTGYNFSPSSIGLYLTVSDVTGIDFTAQQFWFEENDPEIIYTGSWSPYACPSCSGGSLKYSSQTGAKADFSFNGTGIKWVVAKGKMMGKARVYLDGVNMGLVDLYNAGTSLVTLQKTGLAPGNHTVAIEVSGINNPRATDTIINIDAFEIVP